MRAVVQRVTFSKVTVEGEIVGEIGKVLRYFWVWGAMTPKKMLSTLQTKL